MKPSGRFTPEPPPPRAEIWKVSIALASLVLGIGIALFSFHDAGAISDDVFVAVVVFVIAVCIGVILSLDWEQTAHRRVRQPWQEVPPPFDFIALWSSEDRQPSGEDAPNRLRKKAWQSRPLAPFLRFSSPRRQSFREVTSRSRSFLTGLGRCEAQA